MGGAPEVGPQQDERDDGPSGTGEHRRGHANDHGHGVLHEVPAVLGVSPKTLGCASPETEFDGWDKVAAWKGWGKDGSPDVNIFVSSPTLSDGCPLCAIENHIAGPK